MLHAILSAFNEEQRLESSVESLLSNPYIESIHLIDDGSNDSTPYLISKLAAKNSRITYHSNSANIGTVASLDSVASKLSSGFVLFASASDCVLPTLSSTAYSDLIDNPSIGLWSAQAKYYSSLPTIQLPIDFSDVPLCSTKLSPYDASLSFLNGARPFEGSCTFFSVPLVKSFGLNKQLAGFADLLLGIQCLCSKGQISNSSIQSLVLTNNTGEGYLESTYKNLSHSKAIYLVYSSINSFSSYCSDLTQHKQYQLCLDMVSALITYGYIRRELKPYLFRPQHLSSIVHMLRVLYHRLIVTT